MQQQYDVVILGGGLAGLTLSLQLKKHNPDIAILILERRATEAPLAAHKVGESTVELASHYLREVLELKDYLEEHELPKHGLRFFFRSNNKEDITTRVELGPRLRLPVPSHQLDRGTLENHMAKLTMQKGTEHILGAKVSGVELVQSTKSEVKSHKVTYEKDGSEHTVFCRWVADASGRASILKRKLQFQKPMEHHINTAWWRLKGVIDIDQWTENEEWKNKLEPHLRYLSTVHFLDKGYWLWVIPLGTKNTSIGIVADPDIHPFDTFNTYEKAVEWMHVNEPLAYKMLEPLGKEDGLMDFRILKHFAHHSQRIYSAERWAVTGESGAFLDPFYSPGSDFISLNNTWLSDLILRDLAGEDISLRAQVYEQAHLAWVDSFLPIYQEKYKLMGSAQIMVMKIFWDWAVYWSIPCVLFVNDAFTDLKLLRELFATQNGLGKKFAELHKRMQDFFLEWLPYENRVFENKYIDPFDLKLLQEFQSAISVEWENKDLLKQVAVNLEKLEQMAVAIFRLVSSEVKGTAPHMKVNPYTITLNGEVDTTTEKAIEPSASIQKDVETMWFYEKQLAVGSK